MHSDCGKRQHIGQTLEIILQPGDILYQEGSPAECGYIIETGDVMLYSDHTGGRIDCEQRGAGSILGELSILTGQPRKVTVEAMTPCRIYKICPQKIMQKYQSLDPILRACIETSINFTAHFNARAHPNDQQAPMAPKTLKNAEMLISQIKIEEDMLTGLENDEFSMHYQPIVAIESGNIVGAEALMRWRHPQLGAVSPDKFIPIAENMGSINQLTDFALEKACEALHQAYSLHPDAASLFMSVNVSGADLGRADFPDHLAHLMDLHDLAPQCLKLEVTETALVPTGDTSKTVLKRLRDFGCGISIDDFGTGYSNLGYLKSLPLTALKIDRAFAGDAYANAVSRGIVKMLVGLGRELGVDVIAEGLETVDDVNTLRSLGCCYAQGYYFHKPLILDDYIQQLSRQFKGKSQVA